MRPVGELMEVPSATYPTRFSGFFAPVEKGNEPKAGAAAQTETGLSTRLHSFRKKQNSNDYVIDWFYVESFLSDAQNNPVLNATYQATNGQGQQATPDKKSWVLRSYIEAEKHYRGEATLPTPPTLTKERVELFFAHEIGHHRITRLLAIELFRSLKELAVTASGTQAALTEKFDKIEAMYQELEDMVQLAYDVATKGGSNTGEQTNWLGLLERAEREAGDWQQDVTRMTPTFWPGLTYSLATPPPGAAMSAQRLSGELLNVNMNRNSVELSRSLAKMFKASYDAEYNSMASRVAAGGQP